MSFFKTRKHYFQPVREDGKVETIPFLKAAADCTIPFLDILGPKAFYVVKTDINGNVTKLTKKYELDPEKYSTLQDMIDAEIETKTTQNKGSATDALIWLKRALQFIRGMFVNLLNGVNDGENLIPCAAKSYESYLKPYHGWMVQKVFGLVTKAMPYRRDLLKAMGNGQDEETVINDMKEFLVLFGQNLDAVVEMYQSKNIDKEFKV
ncbi:glycolipid transfer protein-like isoform X1 [Ptychodera flava]|uniref:glycolipid transfer protein-like isoform X1 n=1 Tax=Ptychodera flava TaxID=63121 RepID=UPI003969F101